MRYFRKVLERGPEWVAPLLAQLADIPTAKTEEEGFPYQPLPVKWRQRTEWTWKKKALAEARGGYSPIYNEYNIPLRYGTLGINREERRLFLFEDERGRDEWVRPAFHVLDAAKPIVFDVARAVDAEHIGHVIITRLPPGGVIASHVDNDHPIPGLPYWQRYQVPLQGDDGVIFRCGDEEMWLEPGNAYWFDGTRTKHEVRNNSTRPRLSMVLLLRPMFPYRA